MDKILAETKYLELVDKAKNRPLICEGVIFEKHHIKPKSLYPEFAKNPNNLVELTCPEHILAHYYLCFIYPGTEMEAALKVMSFNKLSIDSDETEVLETAPLLGTRRQSLMESNIAKMTEARKPKPKKNKKPRCVKRYAKKKNKTRKPYKPYKKTKER